MKKLLLGLVLAVSALFVVSGAHAQTSYTSTGTKVNNGIPGDATFSFLPDANSNIDAIQLRCPYLNNSGYVYIYELQPNGGTTTYAFKVDVQCSSVGSNPITYTSSGPITVATPDHTVTLQPAMWSAQRVGTRNGYYWHATGGTLQIEVTTLESE